MSKRFERQAVCQPQKFLGHCFELYHQRSCLFELTLSRTVFEFRRQSTGHAGKRRYHPTNLVRGLAKPCRVTLLQRIPNSR